MQLVFDFLQAALLDWPFYGPFSISEKRFVEFSVEVCRCEVVHVA